LPSATPQHVGRGWVDRPDPARCPRSWCRPARCQGCRAVVAISSRA